MQSDHRVSFDGAPDELRQYGDGVDWQAVLAPVELVIYGKIYQLLSMLEWLIVTGGCLAELLHCPWWPLPRQLGDRRRIRPEAADECQYLAYLHALSKCKAT